MLVAATRADLAAVRVNHFGTLAVLAGLHCAVEAEARGS